MDNGRSARRQPCSRSIPPANGSSSIVPDSHRARCVHVPAINCIRYADFGTGVMMTRREVRSGGQCVKLRPVSPERTPR